MSTASKPEDPATTAKVERAKKAFVLKSPTPQPVAPDPNEPPPVDPLSMYEVAMASDRVLKIKRALEAHGFEVKVTTNVTVDMSMEITEPKKLHMPKE